MARGWPLPGALLLLVVLWSVTGCGLPGRRPVLNPPTPLDAQDNSDTFGFSGPYSSVVSPFLGYEVYYRFFAADVPGEPDLQTLTQLELNGFEPLASAQDHDPRHRPLIRIEKPADHSVTLEFGALTGVNDPLARVVVGSDPPVEVQLRRGIVDDTDGRFERFTCSRFMDQHRDVSAIYDQTADDCRGKRVQLQMYAIAYGHTDDGPEYSDARFLGAIHISFQ